MRLRPAMIVALAAILAAACTTDRGEPGEGEPEKADLVVGAPAVPAAAPLDLAVRHGLFKEQGLNVTRKPIEGTVQGMPDLTRGVTDVIYGEYVSVLAAHESGAADLRIVSDLAHASPGGFRLAVPEDSDVQAVKDLEGKTIAVDRFKSISTLGAEKALEDADLTARDVTFVQIPRRAIPAALNEGRADAAFLAEPQVTAYLAAGGRRLDADPLRGLPIAGLVAEESWTDRYPNTMAAFQRAMWKARRLALENDDEITAMYGDITLPAYRVRIDRIPLQDLADLMSALKYTRHRTDPSELMPPSQPEA